MIENSTITNTFNQDSQDTGYQTNSANCGANGSSSSSISCFQSNSSANPSSMMLFMDSTCNYNSNDKVKQKNNPELFTTGKICQINLKENSLNSAK